ncbi:MAG TPA: hypothetical protein PLD67_06725, partial [Sedimentibacter sp.]|nr:hypothetical protein [Sedimentibacter sp.]
RKTLILDDIMGIWHAYENEETILIEFTSDRNINIYDNGEIEWTWSAELTTRNIEGYDVSDLYFGTYPNSEFENFNSLHYINENEININGKTFRKDR